MISEEDYNAICRMIWDVSRAQIDRTYEKYKQNEALCRAHVFFGITDARDEIIARLDAMRRGARCSSKATRSPRSSTACAAG